MFSKFYNETKTILQENGVFKEVVEREFKSNRRIYNLIKARSSQDISSEEVKSISLRIKELIKEERMKKYKSFITKGCNYLKNANYREAWKWLKQISGINGMKNRDQNILDKETGIISKDDKARAKIFRDHLSKLATYKSTNEEAYEAASKDLIPVEVYKSVMKDKKGELNMSKAILKLFNICLEKGFTPEEWKDNIVVMIFKKGESNDVDNYRGITLINTLSKIYCKVLAKRLSELNSRFGLIRKEQIGFIKGEQALSAVVSVIETCQRRKLVGNETWLYFIDLRKAYDLVPHQLLFEKLTKKRFWK